VQHIPLILPTLVVLAVVWAEWRHTRWVAWVALVASFVLLVGVLRYPTLSAQEVTEFAATHFALALVVARTIGAACFLWWVVRTIRTVGVPW